MIKIPLFRPGGRGRGVPRGFALAALSIVAFAQGGCASLGNGGCDPCGSGIGSRLRSCSLFNGSFGSRLFHHGASACEPGCVGDSCGTPIMGGTAGVPIPGPGPMMGSPVEEQIDLSPAGIPAGPTTTTPPAGPTTSTPKPGAQANARAYRPRTGQALARRTITPRPSTPEPASGPAAGAVAEKLASPADDLLANLPPIKPEIDRSDSAKSPPPPPAEEIAKPAPPTTASNPVAPAPSEPSPTASVDPKTADVPPRADDAVFTGAPGVTPFKPLSPLLSGGGVPTAQGWEWLAKEGAYKTVLDLRDVNEDRQVANAAASANGLRYVSLPVSAEKLDSALVKQFLEEIATASAKPLYFFDNDGKRAAALWYIKLVSVDKLSAVEARKQARDIGSPDFDLINASNRYLVSLTTPPSAPENPPAKDASSTTPAPSTTPGPDAGAQLPSAATSASIEKAPSEPAVESISWKPYAALLMAGLGVPLAFLGRSVLFDHQHRASLPAPARSTRSLPPSSDA